MPGEDYNGVKKQYALTCMILCPVLLVDQLTKWCVDSVMSPGDSLRVIEGLFNITYVRNPGAAFGFLSTTSPEFRYIFFLAVTGIAISLILYFIVTSEKEHALLVTSLSLILSGAIGNGIDRIRFGEVIDFLDMYVGAYHWPAFNVADSAISIGAILLVFDMLQTRQNKRKL
jgi:signal peptidase II